MRPMSSPLLILHHCTSRVSQVQTTLEGVHSLNDPRNVNGTLGRLRPMLPKKAMRPKGRQVQVFSFRAIWSSIGVANATSKPRLVFVNVAILLLQRPPQHEFLEAKRGGDDQGQLRACHQNQEAQPIELDQPEGSVGFQSETTTHHFDGCGEHVAQSRSCSDTGDHEADEEQFRERWALLWFSHAVTFARFPNAYLLQQQLTIEPCRSRLLPWSPMPNHSE